MCESFRLTFESLVAQTLLDTIMFSVIFYYMVGLADRESASNFFTFLVINFLFALLSNQQMAMFASFASESSMQVYGAVVLLLGILFGGFILAPDTIPKYYWWIYWCKYSYQLGQRPVVRNQFFVETNSNALISFIRESVCVGLPGSHCERVSEWSMGES